MFKVDTLEQLEDYLSISLAPYDIDRGHEGIRVSDAGRSVARAIRKGSPAAVRIGMLVILRDPSLPFGKLIKSSIARSLKHQTALLSDTEKQRFLSKTADLLTMEFCPREVEDYCKVIKKIGKEGCNMVAARARPTDTKSRALVASLRQFAHANGAD